MYFPLKRFIRRCKCCVLHWRGESLSSWNIVFISGKSGFCAVTYLFLRFKYCAFCISGLGCFSWKNSVCDERNSVFHESWFYQLHWSLRPHRLNGSCTHCEKPEVVWLNKTCHTFAFHGMEGSWPWIISFSIVAFCVVFLSWDERECKELRRIWKENLFSPCKF